MSLKDLAYTPRRAEVRIVLDDDVRRRIDEAKQALAARRREEARTEGLGSKIPELQDALEEAETAADKAAVTFIFEALPRRQLTDLVNACPPTTEQLERWKETRSLMSTSAPEFDWEAFAPRLIAASMVEPETSDDEVREMWTEGAWSDAIWAQLWATAWSVNQEASTRPTFGTGSKQT